MKQTCSEMKMGYNGYVPAVPESLSDNMGDFGEDDYSYNQSNTNRIRENYHGSDEVYSPFYYASF